MGMIRKQVPAHGLKPGDWMLDAHMPAGSRVLNARPMADNPDEVHVQFSSGRIVERDRFYSIERFTSDVGEGGAGGE